MSNSFVVDVDGNAKLDELIACTGQQHSLWLVKDGFPVSPVEATGFQGFIPTAKYLPIMSKGNDSYNSSFHLLLVHHSESGYTVEDGFLMKWTDDTDLFWYNHDLISNVVGFMPLPDVNMDSTYKNKNIGTWG
jgi:hypothetical protein